MPAGRGPGNPRLAPLRTPWPLSTPQGCDPGLCGERAGLLERQLPPGLWSLGSEAVRSSSDPAPPMAFDTRLGAALKCLLTELQMSRLGPRLSQCLAPAALSGQTCLVDSDTI